MEKNKNIGIETIRRKETVFEQFAFSIAKNLGSVWSLLAHTLFFVGIFSLYWLGSSTEQILLILTTVVSLEAIYMSIFIQMTVNRHSEGLSAVQEDIEDIQEDVEEISEDIEDIQEDVKEIGEDVDEISEDIEDISEELDEDEDDKKHHDATNMKLEKIEETLHRLLADIEGLKK
jgi:low affinity Fe/Cu permease